MTVSTVAVAGRERERVTLSAAQLDELRSRVAGPFISSGDAGWDEAVLLWNAIAARAPALVVQPTSAGDVAATVAFARDHGLLLGVKGGGHNIAGTAIADGGLTLDMARLRDATVAPAARRADVGAGCLLQDVDRAPVRLRSERGLGYRLCAPAAPPEPGPPAPA
jgi:hypothetical protein